MGWGYMVSIQEYGALNSSIQPFNLCNFSYGHELPLHLYSVSVVDNWGIGVSTHLNREWVLAQEAVRVVEGGGALLVWAIIHVNSVNQVYCGTSNNYIKIQPILTINTDMCSPHEVVFDCTYWNGGFFSPGFFSRGCLSLALSKIFLCLTAGTAKPPKAVKRVYIHPSKV